VGTAQVRVVFLKNASDRDTTFSVAVDEEGAFEVTPKMGRLPALSQGVPVKIRFAPRHPMNYCRRVTVLIEDALPVFCDLLGTGFIRAKGEVKEQRPAPLRFAHIMAFRNRALAGLGALSPDELDELYEGQGQGQGQGHAAAAALFAQVRPYLGSI
jgi:hypothetical protein